MTKFHDAPFCPPRKRGDPLTGLNLVQQMPMALWRPRPRYRGRNPLTGLNLVQRVPPLRIVLERAPEGGICEKHEAWNIRGVNNGGF